MNLGNIFQRAWNIIWNNKILWFFGILVSCGSWGRGTSSVSYGSDGSMSDYGNMPSQFQHFFYDMERTFNRMDGGDFALIAFGLICLGLIIGVLAFLIRTYGRIALIKGAEQADGGRKLSLRELHNDAKPFYGRALLLNLLLGVAPFVVALVAFILFTFLGVITLGFGFLLLIPVICLLIPIAIAYNVFSEMTNNALVVEDLEISEAFKRGWDVLSQNLGQIALMALIVIVAGFILSFIVALPVLSVSFGGAASLFFGDGSGLFSNLLFLIIGFILALLVTLVLSGILRSYISSVWTLTYLDLSSRAGAMTIKATAPVEPTAPPAKKTAAKKTTAKKTPAKKTAAKKTPAKKTSTKKTPPKKKSS